MQFLRREIEIPLRLYKHKMSMFNVVIHKHLNEIFCFLLNHILPFFFIFDKEKAKAAFI